MRYFCPSAIFGYLEGQMGDKNGRKSAKSTTASTTKQSKSVFVVTSIGQSMRKTLPMTTIYYPLRQKLHGMLATSYMTIKGLIEKSDFAQ